MNKLKFLLFIALMLMLPIFVVMQVGNSQETIPDVPPVTTIPKICEPEIPPRLTLDYVMYSDNPLIQMYIHNRQCELDAAYTSFWTRDDILYRNGNRIARSLNAEQHTLQEIKIKDKYNLLINNAIKQSEINEQKQKQIDKYNQGVKMNQAEIVTASWFTIGALVILCTFVYFWRRHLDANKLVQDKEERQYNLEVKKLELNQTLQLQQAELEKYKTLELSKTQMDNEHEVALKKIEFDKSIDARDFMFTVTKEERDYLLKQRELDIKEGKSSPSLMDIVDSNKDVQFRLKK